MVQEPVILAFLLLLLTVGPAAATVRTITLNLTHTPQGHFEFGRAIGPVIFCSAIFFAMMMLIMRDPWPRVQENLRERSQCRPRAPGRP